MSLGMGHAVVAQTLIKYAAACDKAIGVTIPDFNCDDGTIIPTTNFANGKCDRPNRLNEECDPNSTFTVLKKTAKAYAVALCRKRGETEGKYGDIAVIQHNIVTGATCFYQALGSLKGNVKAPSKKGENVYPWLQPEGVARLACASCHDIANPT